MHYVSALDRTLRVEEDMTGKLAPKHLQGNPLQLKLGFYGPFSLLQANQT